MAVGTAMSPNKTPLTTKSISGSPSSSPRSISCPSRTSSAVSSSTLTHTSTSTTSSHKSSWENEVSYCPLCGIQILATNGSVGNIDTRSKYIDETISSIADGTSYLHNNRVGEPRNHDNMSTNSWIRTMVSDHEDHPPNGFHHVDFFPSLLKTDPKITSDTMHRRTDIEPSNLPASTCWVCLQATIKEAKARQIEEDRKLAISLSGVTPTEHQALGAGFHSPSFPFNTKNNKTSCNPFENHDPGLTRMRCGDEGQVPQEWAKEFQRKKPVVASATMMEDEWPHSDFDRSIDTENERESATKNCFGTDHSKKNSTFSDDSCVYIGEYNIMGQRHGSHGELIWDSGDRYVGTFKNGVRSGQGTLFFRDGSEYTGDWKENQMHGSGQRKFKNGDIYVGQYRKGQRSGGPRCKFKFANGDLYVGEWLEDRFHGFGRYFFADGSVLEGNFVQGVKQGKFKRQLATEDLDILRFEDDKIVGQGVRWNKKRTKTWLLELFNAHDRNRATQHNAASNVLTLRREDHGGAARRLLRGFGKLTLRRDFCHPQRMVATEKFAGRDDEFKQTNANFSTTSVSMSLTSSSSSLPIDNLVPVTPQNMPKKIVKKSTRIPISEAVSIGYDCEIGLEQGIGLSSTKP